MSQISFDLAGFFRQTFGYDSPAFSPDFADVTGDGGRSSGRREKGQLGSSYYANDLLAREYYMPVEIIYPDKEVLTSWQLPHPVITITSKKTIVETPLTERRGTVKELINVQDYDIVIKGFIIGSTHEFPEDQVTVLRTVYEQNVPLSIKCPLTDIFLLRPDRKGSDKVVITELKFPAVTGIKNVRPYELHMISDEPFNLLSIS